VVVAGGGAHVEGPARPRDRGLAGGQAREDAAADGMGQGAEGEIEMTLVIVNH
jgi:hypothetical protein